MSIFRLSLLPLFRSRTQGALRTALHETVNRGNPTVKYDRTAPPILCKYAGVKSWSTFARNASLWTMDAIHDLLRIEPNSRGSDGSFTPDESAVETLPDGSTVDDLIERMIAILQEATHAETRSAPDASERS